MKRTTCTVPRETLDSLGYCRHGHTSSRLNGTLLRTTNIVSLLLPKDLTLEDWIDIVECCAFSDKTGNPSDDQSLLRAIQSTMVAHNDTRLALLTKLRGYSPEQRLAIHEICVRYTQREPLQEPVANRLRMAGVQL